MDAIYRRLSHFPLIKYNYSLKFLFVAFVGIHIPLIGIIFFVLNSPAELLSSKAVIMLVLGLTLASTGVTLYVLRRLLSPLLLSDKALKEYMSRGVLPALPTHFPDEAGRLMMLIQETINHLDRLSTEKRQMASLVTHNLRTPLNQIVALCELVKIDTEHLNTYIGQIETITKSQLDTLSRLLEQLAATVSSIGHVELLEYDVNSFIQDEVLKLKSAFAQKNINVIQNLSKENLHTNRSKSNLSLVLQNLLSNAVKFSYDGQSVTITTARKDNQIQISVKDEGLGFSEKYAKTLFDDARKSGRKGTANEPSVGLGLHLSKKIIEQTGGSLQAHSDGDGKGACFTITF